MADRTTNGISIQHRRGPLATITEYGSLNDPEISSSVVKSSWPSSYSRAVNFQAYRDRASDIEDEILFSDTETEFPWPTPIQVSELDEDDSRPSEEQILIPKATVLIPKSTFWQSLFNSVNILMGIGLLSLPYAFSLTGFAVGIGLFLLFAIITWHTARLLQFCLDFKVNGSTANTYGDLGENAFGPNGRTFISIIFFLELFAACVALVILSADSIVALLPQLDLIQVKISIVLLCLPMTFPRSLAIASYGSLIGILALMNLMGILIYDGLTTLESPGSLLNPSDYTINPVELFPIPFSFGLLMAGFAGHSGFLLLLVFPSIYRDMKSPTKYPSLLNWTYLIIVVMYALIASAGYLMFGSSIMEEISQNLPMVSGYSKVLNQVTVALIAVNPITKYALTMSPVTHQIGMKS